jgi:hypothetical protein
MHAPDLHLANTATTPTTSALVDLLVAVSQGEARGLDLMRRNSTTSPDGSFAFGELDDHRAAVAGDMADALDRIAPGLGLRWMQSMYPEVDYSKPAEEMIAEIRAAMACQVLPPVAAPNAGRLQ